MTTLHVSLVDPVGRKSVVPMGDLLHPAPRSDRDLARKCRLPRLMLMAYTRMSSTTPPGRDLPSACGQLADDCAFGPHVARRHEYLGPVAFPAIAESEIDSGAQDG